MATNPPHLRPPEIHSRDFLRHYARLKRRRSEPVMCLQVGANDGVTNDPVNPYLQGSGWTGLLVEPLVDVFENELKRTYAGNDRVKLENVALAPSAGHMAFHRVAISSARWATGLSTFRRESIEEHIENGYIARMAEREGVPMPADPADVIETIQVPTVPVEDLLARHGIERFQVLCVDTEGFDYEILKLVDLERHRPEVVFFESKNLSDDDFTAALDRLRAAGYSLFWDDGDTLATTVRYPRALRAALAGERRLRARLGLVRRRLRRSG